MTTKTITDNEYLAHTIWIPWYRNYSDTRMNKRNKEHRLIILEIHNGLRDPMDIPSNL